MSLQKGQRKGNNGNHGKAGVSGRKSFYQELADAKFLAEMFFKQHTQQQIRGMLASGKYSVSEVMLSKALAGDVKSYLAIFHKLFPDKHEFEDKNLTELFKLQTDIRSLVRKKKKTLLPAREEASSNDENT